MNLDTDLPPFTTTNSKWITDQNINHYTMKILDHTGSNQGDLSYGSDFLDRRAKAPSRNKPVGQLEFMKLKLLLQTTLRE